MRCELPYSATPNDNFCYAKMYGLVSPKSVDCVSATKLRYANKTIPKNINKLTIVGIKCMQIATIILPCKQSFWYTLSSSLSVHSLSFIERHPETDKLTDLVITILIAKFTEVDSVIRELTDKAPDFPSYG